MLQEIKENNVRVTFSDIWRDYQNYRKAYYFTKVMDTPKEIFQQQEVPVDLDNYSTVETLKQIWKDRHAHPKMSVNSLFCFLVWMSSSFVLFLIIRIPLDWYYDFKDPLEKKDEAASTVSAEATLRRLKYKKKVSNWQDYPYNT